MRGSKALAFLSLSLPALVRGSLVDDIVSAIENAVSCASCHALLVPLYGLAAISESAFTDTFVEVCQVLGIFDNDVCQGIIGQQAPVLGQDLINISEFDDTSTKLCNALLGLCQPPNVAQYTFPIPKPPPANPKVWTSKGNPPFQVAHFSDVHVDRQYTPGTESNCNKPICCRNYPDYPTASTPAGQTASFHCDTSPALAHSMLQALPSTKFSIFTGDVIETAIWLVNEQNNVNDMNLFQSDLSTYLKSPLYPAIGNHEAAPVNLFPRNTTTDHASDMQWIFDTQASNWAAWLDTNAQSQVSHYSGSYAQVATGTSLRIISLNTVYWYKFNFYLFDSDNFQPDPNGILGFLVQQLQAAEDAGQRAWIIGHMPPGGPDTLWDQSNYFDQIVQRYKNTIAAQFYGHSHLDQFEIGYSDYSNQNAQTAVSIAMIAPSLTPRSGNPAFKFYDIDPDTYEIMDAKTYRGDITNPSFQTNPTWNQYYSVRQTWGALVGWPATQSLTPAFWHQLTQLFQTNDAAFQQYNTFMNRGVLVSACDATCKSATICGLRAQRAENNCVVASPGLNFKRSEESSKALASVPLYESCEGAHLSQFFSKLPQAFAKAKKEQSKVDLKAIFAKHINGTRI